MLKTQIQIEFKIEITDCVLINTQGTQIQNAEHTNANTNRNTNK